MTKYTDEELSMLTDEERAAYDEGQDFDEGEGKGTTDADTGKDGAHTADETPIVVNDDDDKTAKKPDEGADDGKKKPDDTAAATDTDAAKKAADDQAAADAAAAAQAADTQAQTDAAAEEPPVRRPLSMTQLPEDYDAQVAKIGTDKDALVAKFDEGDLTMAEYHHELDGLNRKERELERLKDRVEYEARAQQTHWSDVVVAGFLSHHPEYEKNQMLLGLLDGEVRKQQAAHDDQFDPAYLTNAHKTISDSLPAMFAASTTKPADKGQKQEIPRVPSLAHVPAADVDRPADGKFAALDRLADTDPLAYEKALDKMSDAERDEYLAS